MREVKFRAWVKAERKMYAVSEINFDCERITVIKDENGSKNEVYFYFNEIELMQSTNLFDSYGTEIFEGDIIKLTYYVGKVSFVESGACYGACRDGFMGWRLDYDTLKNSRVVDHILNNPDFAKGENHE